MGTLRIAEKKNASGDTSYQHGAYGTVRTGAYADKILGPQKYCGPLLPGWSTEPRRHNHHVLLKAAKLSYDCLEWGKTVNTV